MRGGARRADRDGRRRRGGRGRRQRSPQLAEPSDAYYHQIPLAAPGVEYRDAAGGEIEAGDLRDGDLVSVWIGDGCAESFPPQCDLRAVHVTG